MNKFRCAVCNKMYQAGEYARWCKKTTDTVKVCVTCHDFIKLSKTKYAIELADYFLKIKNKNKCSK